MRRYLVIDADDDVEITWRYPDETPTTKVVHKAPPKPVAEARHEQTTDRSLS